MGTGESAVESSVPEETLLLYSKTTAVALSGIAVTVIGAAALHAIGMV